MKKDDFLALARLWAKEKKPYLKRSTYAAYSFIVHFYLLPCFPFAEDLTPSALREFALGLIDRGLSSKTTRDIIQVAKMILDFKDLQLGRTPQPLHLRLPSQNPGHEVDVLSVKEESRFTSRQIGQGACVHKGRMYIPVGVGTEEQPSILYVWNLRRKRLEKVMNLQEPVPAEFEDCEPYRGDLLIQTNGMGVVRVHPLP